VYFSLSSLDDLNVKDLLRLAIRRHCRGKNSLKSLRQDSVMPSFVVAKSSFKSGNKNRKQESFTDKTFTRIYHLFPWAAPVSSREECPKALT
jgi:hypothetical protein